MSNKLSHSSVNMLGDCPKKWQLHYQERIRGTTQSAALLFGTAIDKAVEDLVLTRNLEDAKRTFLAYWNSAEINGIQTKLEDNPDIVYATNDLDEELLPESFTMINAVKLLEVIGKKKEIGFDNLELADKIVYNQANWLVAKKRGELMLEAVNEQILPKINKVYSTQEKIDLTNDSGDSVVGYTDLVADYLDKGTIVFDVKTSTRSYEEDSVRTSPQLALYVHALADKYKTRKAGFIVLSKAIQKNRKKICKECKNDGTGGRHKTCDKMIEPPMTGPGTGKPYRCNGEWIETINPKCKVDVIIDDIPERLEDIVLENMDNSNKLINNGIFSRNLSACIKNYGPCIYYKLCHENSMEGLIKLENSKDKRT